MGCKDCQNKKYDKSPCAWYRGWFCAVGKWDERGNEEHKESDYDTTWLNCKDREI